MPEPDDADAGPEDGGSPRVLLYAAAAIALVVVAAIAGMTNPPRPSGISTDRLGPEYGQPVANYLDAARQSLTGGDTVDHWALLSFTEELPPQRLPEVAGGLRISQALYRVPIADVQTPVVAVPLPSGDDVARTSASAAAGQLAAGVDRTSDDRYRRVLTVSAGRLRADCACAVGLVVRGPLTRLTALTADPGVRAVQALPADAVSGGFAVNPLLPSQRDLAVPGPDTGPVPAS